MCTESPLQLTRPTLEAFRLADIEHLAKREIDPSKVRSLDGSRCVARSADGVATTHDGACQDLGEAYTFAPPDGTHGFFPLRFLPPPASLGAGAVPEAARHAAAALPAL